MNNNITEDYVSFEIAKLLKEKGFEVPTVFYFKITGGYMFPQPTPFNHNDDSKNETAGGMTYVSAPTQALAIKWIRENFGIHISFLLRHEEKIGYDFYIEKIEITNEYKNIGPKEFFYYESPEQAADAALLYTLKHLI